MDAVADKGVDRTGVGLKVEVEGGAQGREGQALGVIAREIGEAGLAIGSPLPSPKAGAVSGERDISRAEDSPVEARSRRRASAEAARSTELAILSGPRPLGGDLGLAGVGRAGAAARAMLRPAAAPRAIGAELAGADGA